MVGIILNIVKCVLVILWYNGIVKSVENANNGGTYTEIKSDLLILIMICLV